jgi:cell wall-associated NlpC family hydrolase
MVVGRMLLRFRTTALAAAALLCAAAPAAHAAGISMGTSAGAPPSGTPESSWSASAAAAAPPTPAPAPASVAHAADRALRLGAHGADVRTLQELLTAAGCRVAASGTFNSATAHCVRWWQTYAGVAPDGVMTKGDFAYLRQDTALQSPPVTRRRVRHTTFTASAAPASSPALPVTGPPGQATMSAGGLAVAPSDAPLEVQEIIAAGDRIATTPYLWGGGHGAWVSPGGYDCSGSVSYVLHAAGLLASPEVSGDLASWGDPGPGRWVTIYANNGHVWMVIAGLRFDTRSLLATPYSRWNPTSASPDGYAIRHPPGL